MRNKMNWIKIIGYVIIFTCLGILIGVINFSLLPLFYNTNASFFSIVNVYFFIAYTILFWGIYLLHPHYSFNDIKNRYVSLSIVLILTLLFFGLGVYNELFAPLIPIKTNIAYHIGHDFTDGHKTGLTCYSLAENEDLVIGDMLFCRALFNGATNNKGITICDIDLESNERNCTNVTDAGKIDYEDKTTGEIKLVGRQFFINISSTEMPFKKRIYISGDRDIQAMSTVLGPIPVSYEVYRQEHIERQNNRISMLFLMISISIFSVLSAVSNLKEILENTQEKLKAPRKKKKVGDGGI
jgi:hypothetical protein